MQLSLITAFVLRDVAPFLPDGLRHIWQWEPAASLLLVGWIYVGRRRLRWARHTWPLIAVATGLLALLVAFASPLASLGRMLLSAQMIQHLLVTMVAAPLLFLGLSTFDSGPQWALPRTHPFFQSAGNLLARPLVAWLLFAGALALWHLPGLHRLAAASTPAGLLQHGLLFGAALLFWRTVIRAGRSGSLRYPAALLFTAATMAYTALLALILIFSAATWYPYDPAQPAIWGMTPLEDQRAAGWFLLLPTMTVYLTVILWLMYAWFDQMDRAERQQAKPLRPSRKDR